MYALLAICVSLAPVRIDDVVLTALREKWGDKMALLQADYLTTTDAVKRRMAKASDAQETTPEEDLRYSPTRVFQWLITKCLLA